MEAPFYSAGLIVNEIFLMGGTRNHEDLLQNSYPTIFIHRTISICSIFIFFTPGAGNWCVDKHIYTPIRPKGSMGLGKGKRKGRLLL